jgi:hypothetical protein
MNNFPMSSIITIYQNVPEMFTEMETDYEMGLSMDDSDTMDKLSNEEWVIRELSAFNTRAIANLKIGLAN